MKTQSVASLDSQPSALFRLRSFVAASAVLLLTLTASAKAPANPAEPTPVQITHPVEILGSVEIVGEPHKQPFVISASASPLSDLLTIPLPPGKRIVVESISVTAVVPVGAKLFGWAVLKSKVVGESGSSGLQFVEQGTLEDKTYFMSVTPATMRINTDNHTLQINVYRTNAWGAYSFSASVFGYIETIQ